MFSSLFGLFCLVLGFGALFYTFIWLARLWWRQLGSAEPVPREGEPSEEGPLVEGEIEAIENVRATMGYGTNYGLVLGILACLFFKVSPIMLILSLVAIFYSAKALWEGIWRFRTVLIRGVIGLLLGMASIALHFLEVSGQLPPIAEML